MGWDTAENRKIMTRIRTVERLLEKARQEAEMYGAAGMPDRAAMAVAFYEDTDRKSAKYIETGIWAEDDE